MQVGILGSGHIGKTLGPREVPVLDTSDYYPMRGGPRSRRPTVRAPENRETVMGQSIALGRTPTCEDIVARNRAVSAPQQHLAPPTPAFRRRTRYQ